jgi:hypothetical protein
MEWDVVGMSFPRKEIMASYLSYPVYGRKDCQALRVGEGAGARARPGRTVL